MLLGPQHVSIPEDESEADSESEEAADVEEFEGEEGGSSSRQETERRNTAEKAKVNDAGREVFDTICRTAQDSLQPGGYGHFSSNIHHLLRSVMLDAPASNAESEATEEEDLTPGSDYCLSLLARRCSDTAVTESHVLLMGLVQAIEFAAHVQRMKRDNKVKFTVLDHIIQAESVKQPTLSEEESQPQRRALRRHVLNRFYSLGLRCCYLAGSGSIYLLFLIAIARIWSSLMKILATIIAEIGKVIAYPDDSYYGKRVKETIIPVVSALMKMYPISGKVTFFSRALTLLGDSEDDDFNATDLSASEKIFYSLGLDTWVKDRDWAAWAPCAIPVNRTELWSQEKLRLLHERALSSHVALSELLESMTPSEASALALPPGLVDNWDKIVDTPDTVVISTMFDPKHSKNVKNAKEPVSVQDIEVKLKEQLKKGYRSKQSQYTIVDTALFSGKNLKILDKEGGLIAFILASMPEDLRKRVFEELHMIFPNMIQDVKSKDEQGFHTIHLSWYNRFSTGGEGVPTDTNPLEHRNITTTRVTVPRESQESLEWEHHKMQLMDALAPMFEWISSTTQLQTLLPDTFEVLQHSVDILPLGESPLVYPFTGFVINFNIATLVHRDFGDKEICLVFQVSDCTGGELGMVEPGMVVRLRNCDGIIFRSHRITHFNNDFEGRRLSLVLHTDCAMDTWEKGGYNGWGGNVNFRASHHVEADPNEGEPHPHVNDLFSVV